MALLVFLNRESVSDCRGIWPHVRCYHPPGVGADKSIRDAQSVDQPTHQPTNQAIDRCIHQVEKTEAHLEATLKPDGTEGSLRCLPAKGRNPDDVITEVSEEEPVRTVRVYRSWATVQFTRS